MKKDNKQVLLEAKANLEAAKMLEAINSIAMRRDELGKLYGANWDKTIEVLQKTLDFIKAFKLFKDNSDCVGKEIQFVKDIVDGIKSKAKYEIEIKDLKKKLDIAAKSYEIALNENKSIKQKLIKFMENLVDEKIDKQEIKNFIQDNRSIDRIIDNYFQSTLVTGCKTDESPF